MISDPKGGGTVHLERLVFPLAVLSIVLAAWIGWEPVLDRLGAPPSDTLHDGIGQAMLTAVLASIGFLTVRGMDVFVWKGMIARRNVQVPRMLVDLAALVVWSLVFLVVLSGVYGQSVTALITTSTVALGVAGFAVRSLIADFFAGIALSIERPFAMGDWIQVDTKGAVGRVVEQTWRATRVVTNDEVAVIVPNSYLAGQPFRNYSAPERFFRDELLIPLPFEVTTHQAQRILLGAANQIDEVARLPRSSSVSIAEFTTSSIIWRLQYWVSDYEGLAGKRFKVHSNILRNLHFAGISLPVAIEEVRTAAPPVAEFNSPISRLLQQAPLFSELKARDIDVLAAGALQSLYHRGERILSQGDPGSSLFVLNEGLLSVLVAGADGLQSEVGQIYPGNFFGEMSLLTGAARGATVVPVVDSVVTEIGSDAMAELLRASPEVAEILSNTLAERQAANMKHSATRAGSAGDEDSSGLARQILGRIRGFFKLQG